MSKTGFQAFDQNTHPKLRSIVAIAGTEYGKTWIAAYNGILIYDDSTNEYSSIASTFPGVDFTNDRIMSLSVTNTDAWIGYRSTGLERYTFEGGSLKTYGTASSPALTSDAISAILPLASGETLVGTYGGGLNLIQPDNSVRTFTQNNMPHSINDNKVIMLYQTSDGVIWVGTESGLQSFDLGSQSFQPISSRVASREWPMDRIVLSMKESTNGYIWLGTMHDGLFRLQHESENPDLFTLTQFPLQATPASNTIYAVELDQKDNVWVSTNSGISRFDQEGQTKSNFSQSNGLIDTEFDFGASHKDSQGRLYFGGSNGYNRFHPDNIDIDSSPPTVVLTGLNIAGKTPELPVALQDLELIELAHEEYFITFIFSALDFLDPSKNQYSYKLENFDPEWIDNSTRNSATYTNLPPGEYTFRVRGANSAGVWNMEGASVRVRVLPSRWLTWWALMSYAIAIAVLVAVAKRFYDHRLIAKRATLDAKKMTTAANQASDDLQEQLEIQDDLVKSVYKHSLETLDWVRDIISLQANFFPDDSMRDAIESYQARILALGQLESCVFYQGDAVFVDLNKYTDLVIGLALQSCPIPIESIVTTNEITKRLVPRQIATPLALIAYELIHNCAQHAFANEASANYIQISLVATKTDPSAAQALTLSVQDNGIGMSENLSSQGADSVGLSIVNAIVEKLGGLVEIDRRSGTRVTITLPNTPDLLVL